MKQYGTENEAVRSKMCQNLAEQRGVCCRRLERYQSIFKRNRQTAAKTLLGRVIRRKTYRTEMLLCIQKHLQCTEAHLFFQMSGLNTEILKMSDYLPV